jgi:DNA-binding XRE family transcriptional regulator
MVIYYHEFSNQKSKLPINTLFMDSKEVLRLFMLEFSENLKKIRATKYNSMDEVAQNSNFDSSNYNKFENGKGNPTIETMLKMSSAFGITPKNFLTLISILINIRLTNKKS